MEFVLPSDVCNVSKTPIGISNPFGEILDSNFEIGEIKSEWSDGTLSDLYGIDSEALRQYSSDSLFLPWIHFSPVKKYKDVFFNIYRCPKELKKQKKRLMSTLKSIKDFGYKPEDFKNRQGGHITGYYLSLNGSKKFYVVSGNHRVAILSYLFPEERFPSVYDRKSFLKDRDLENSILKDNYPNIFFGENVNNWPSIKSGFIDREIALNILEKYMGEQL
jgi:hypothetical protein